MPNSLIPVFNKFSSGKEMTFEEFFSIFEKSKLTENKKIEKKKVEEIFNSTKSLSKNCEGVTYDQFLHALDLVAKSIDADLEDLKKSFDGLAGNKHSHDKKDVIHQQNVQTGNHGHHSTKN